MVTNFRPYMLVTAQLSMLKKLFSRLRGKQEETSKDVNAFKEFEIEKNQVEV